MVARHDMRNTLALLWFHGSDNSSRAGCSFKFHMGENRGNRDFNEKNESSAMSSNYAGSFPVSRDWGA